MPSATGNGVAFLHTLYRHPEQVVRPFMVLGRSREGVDFDSLDGQPTTCFSFSAQVSRAASSVAGEASEDVFAPEAIQTLMTTATADEIFAALAAAERELTNPQAGEGVEKTT